MIGAPVRRVDGVAVRDGLPMTASPEQPGMDLGAWLAQHLHALRGLLDDRGAVLFRGFDVPDGAAFLAAARVICEPAAYEFRSTRRTAVGPGLYTSTDVPPDAEIPMHCESSYQRSWPGVLLFYCERPAARGGETPLSDMRAVTREIPPPVRAAYRERRVTYVRNLGTAVDLHWREVFQVERPEDAEACCARLGVDHAWRPGGVLRIRHSAQGLAVHPRTGDEVWFNQADAYHPSSLGPSTAAHLVGMFGEDGLPRNALHGDGARLDPADLASVRALLAKHAVPLSWARGDVLIVDNMLVAHGRRPFVRPRSVLVVMGDLR